MTEPRTATETTDPVRVDAPIVAVTVYPDRARVTRRGVVPLPAGEHRIRVAPLPLGLHRDSVRVGGRGPATVLGVDVLTDRQPRSTDETVAGVEERRRQVSAEIAALTDDDAVEASRAEFLTLLAQRAGGTYARALAAGESTPADVATFADSVAGQLADSRGRRRELHRRADEARDRLAAIDRQLTALSGGSRQPDRLAVEVTVAVDSPDAVDPSEVTGADPAEVQLELSYVVDGAGWQSSYDLRLVDQTLTLTWFGLVSQRSGEDWPECELLLSTARPAATASLPELEPWYLDRLRPLPPPAPMRAFGAGAAGGPPMPGAQADFGPAEVGAAAPAGARMRSAARKAEPVTERVASVEHGVLAATYRPARAVAVPADGAAHRATVAVTELTTALDYVTAPARAAEAHLRATVVNSSAHTLLPGPAAVFHGGDFVGSIALPIWAPGEEVELALGVDDRVRVERELTRRSDTRATLGSTRRRETEHRVTVTNHTPRPARITVLDQIPVSRDEAITVREPRLDPPPAERTDLGELTWRFELAPGEAARVVTGLRVELAKGVELLGWRE